MITFAALQTGLVALLVGGSAFYVARSAWRSIRAASAERAAGCGGCNGCGGCPSARD